MSGAPDEGRPVLEAFVEAIEAAMRSRRGKEHVLSPRDFALARGWHEAGVSLATVLVAIDAAFERDPTTASLALVRRRVEDLAGGARTGGALPRETERVSLPEVAEKDVPPKLTEKKACFVTLTKDGALRGCIGHLTAMEPLYRAVVENARNAALRDPRFTPVESGELDKIKIEISVLTEPQPLAFSSPDDLLSKLHPNEDGVLLHIGPRTATFLPQVWAQIPDKVKVLEHLSQKAGCEPSAWRGKDVSVSTYHVECFEEEHTRS